MTETTDTPTPKKPTARKPRATKPKPNPVAYPDTSVVVLSTTTAPLVIRANPSDEEVLAFVVEHNRRYEAGEPGGPAGHSAAQIVGATRYATEQEWLADNDECWKIDLPAKASTPQE